MIQASCSTCGGTGGKKDCPTCTGRKKIACASCGGRGRVPPKWSKERIKAEIDRRRAQMREEQDALEHWYEEVERKPYLYDDGDFPGRGNESAISRLREEISDLVSWL